MKISASNNKAFGASIPIYYYAKGANGKVSRVYKKENLKKCHSYIIRNLTGSKKEIDTNLVNNFKRFDSAYKSSNRVRSLYDDPNGVVYLVTGNKDCNQIKEWASTLGQTKQESLEIAKTTDTFEVKEAARAFFKKALEYVKNPMIRKKNQQGNLMFIKALFDAEYKKNGEIKGFNFSKILFCSEV